MLGLSIGVTYKDLDSIWKLNLYAKNGVFWDVTPCGSCKNWRFGGT
jgi:hypothetical protein